MYSFYGGRPGNSFVIITTFKSVDDMVTAFKKGPEYKTVHYDEYVMINTDNKNNLENGRLYRRGYQFTNSMGGAEYIGTIAGPSGNAPQLTIETINEVKAKNVPDGYSGKSQNGEYSVSNSALVPGKTKDVNGDDVYNDSIKWASCSIVNENNEETTAYLGFTFPYPVIEFSTKSVEPYLGGSYADTLSIFRDDKMDHPFYERWKIQIPKGIKGDTFKNFRVITASSNDGVQQYDGQSDDRSGNREILVYDYYNYDKKENGNPKTLYLGDYNMIEGISVSDDGTLTINYTHDTNYIKTKLFKWINSIILTADGTFTVTYNYDSDAQGNPTTYSTRLDWIKNISISDEGIITLTHNNNDTDTLDTKVKWCKGVSLDKNGNLSFTWNDNSESSPLGPIQWIDSINLNENGILSITYNTFEENNNTVHKQQIFDNKIKWIKNITLDNNTGDLIVTYNTLNNNGEDETQIFANAIKSINSIEHSVNNDANPRHGYNGELSINYNTGKPDIINLDLLTDISMNQDTGVITAQWNGGVSSLQYSNIGAVNFIKNVAIDNDGNLVVKYSNSFGETTVNGEAGWFNLGKVAPYGNNLKMTISKILRGKHYIDSSDNKTYLEFYIENMGLLRTNDSATITSGTATIYYNGSQVGINPVNLAGQQIQNITSTNNTDLPSELSTFIFKVELDGNLYPTTTSLDFVDIDLKNVIISIGRNQTSDISTIGLNEIVTDVNANTQAIINLNNAMSSTSATLSNKVERSDLTNLTNNIAFNIVPITYGTIAKNNLQPTANSAFLFYNNFLAIIQGHFRVYANTAISKGATVLDFTNIQLPHKFKDIGTIRFTDLSNSGRNFYIKKGSNGKVINQIYHETGNFSWGGQSEAWIQIIIPFDLTT